MTLEELRVNFPKTFRKFKSKGVHAIQEKKNIDLKLENFLFEEGYSLLSIWNMDKRKMRPNIVYNETITGIQKAPIFNDFELTTQDDCRSITLPVALKHYEEHL